MNNLFNINNGFFTFLGKMCDVLFLSILWFIFCIPIVTIGPATTALYYSTVKVIRRERGYLFREFFKSFRMNFKRAAIVGVALTLVFVILSLDISSSWTALSSNSNLSSIFFGIYLAITFLALGFTVYVFPVLSRFDLNVKQLIKTSALMALRHLPSTFLMLVILLSSIVVVVLVMPLLVVIVPATSTLLTSLIMERIFKKYMPKSEETEENKGKDEWYLE